MQLFVKIFLKLVQRVDEALEVAPKCWFDVRRWFVLLRVHCLLELVLWMLLIDVAVTCIQFFIEVVVN